MSEEVTITRTEMQTVDEAGEPVTVVAVTFRSRSIPPTTIWIPKSEWTPELEEKLIKEKIKELRKRKAEKKKIELK